MATRSRPLRLPLATELALACNAIRDSNSAARLAMLMAEDTERLFGEVDSDDDRATIVLVPPALPNVVRARTLIPEGM